jgi:organic hydroperoxide reductase OsmC/OhrA
MEPYPHTYSAKAVDSAKGPVPVMSGQLPAIETAPPAQFDGPGNTWSPETLLVASIADCFVLTFRGVARAGKFSWKKLECAVDGTLERVEGKAQFSRFTTRATLTIDIGSDHSKARELLERAEKACLVANSLRGERILDVRLIEEAPSVGGDHIGS